MKALPTWRERYGCKEPACNRSRVFDRPYCARHDRPDETIRAERWRKKHPGEQLPCAGCTHRRVFHCQIGYAEGPVRGRRRVVGEIMVPCSIPDCACESYVTS